MQQRAQKLGKRKADNVVIEYACSLQEKTHITKLQGSLAAAAVEKTKNRLEKIIRNRKTGPKVDPRVQPPRQVTHDVEYFHTDSKGDFSSDDDSIPSIEYEDLLAARYGLRLYTDIEHLRGV